MAATDLVTVARYRVITLDTTSADAAVTAALESALGTVEDELDRHLVSAERTETYRIYRDRRVYPKAYPVTDAGTATIDPGGRSLRDMSPDSTPGVFDAWSDSNPPTVEITYTGGYTASTLPETLAQEIAWRANDLLNAGQVSASSVLANASSMTVGDASVSFSSSNGGGGVAAASGRPTRAQVRRYRRVRAA